MRTPALTLAAAIFGVVLSAGSASAAPGLANLELPRESPVGKLSQQVGLTEIAVEYGSPAVAGRKVWGALVPFDRLWSLGGYQAAKVRFSRDVTVGDKPVAAGTYALFAIPGKTSWTLILNKNADQLGSAHDYRGDLDVARVQVRAKPAPFREHLTFAIPDFTDDGATLELAWEKVKVALPIKVNTTEEVLTNISSLDNTWRAYANAARYMLETKKDYDQGLKYVAESLALREDWYNLWIKALLLGTRGSYKDAGTAAERALELGLKAGDPLFPEQELRKALASWSQKSVAAR
jgi:tetratricopeptide (TPR) repeat protein